MFMKSILTIAAAGAIVFAAGAANATVATYTTATAYNAFGGGGTIGSSDPVDWGVFSKAQGNATINNSSVANGSSMSTGSGEKVVATNGAANSFNVYTNGATGGLAGTRWDGNFASGTNILATGSTKITLTFTGAITGFGIDAQTSNAGAYGVTIQAYNSSGTLIGTASNSGTSTGRSTNGKFNEAAFAGLTSTAGNISYVVITATGANTSAGFAIDTSLIYHFANSQISGNSQATPEPGTLGLLGAGLVGLGWVRRRRSQA